MNYLVFKTYTLVQDASQILLNCVFGVSIYYIHSTDVALAQWRLNPQANLLFVQYPV